MENHEILIFKYILEEDDNLDLLTQDLLDVEKKENNNLIKNEKLIIQDKKEIIIEININSLDDENELDFIDNDFEYIDDYEDGEGDDGEGEDGEGDDGEGDDGERDDEEGDDGEGDDEEGDDGEGDDGEGDDGEGYDEDEDEDEDED